MAKSVACLVVVFVPIQAKHAGHDPGGGNKLLPISSREWRTSSPSLQACFHGHIAYHNILRPYLYSYKLIVHITAFLPRYPPICTCLPHVELM
eukprot:SAG31_NODE_9833_length_1221_cov_1.124666_1_plen_93_part_00